MQIRPHRVATVLTVYGIETVSCGYINDGLLLQQYLPFTVLKLLCMSDLPIPQHVLQQYLPFTVLKLYIQIGLLVQTLFVATVLTVYSIET